MGSWPGKSDVRHALADDDHALGAVFVAVVEVAALQNRHAEGSEESRRDRSGTCAQIVLAVLRGVAPCTANAKLMLSPCSSRQGTLKPVDDVLHAGQRATRRFDLAIELAAPARESCRSSSPARLTASTCEVSKGGRVCSST